MARSPLTKSELLNRILNGISFSQFTAYVIARTHPFQIAIECNDVRRRLRVYIWNCTHGGGIKRPKEEYRIQITGAPIILDPNAENLLLGWHEGYEVFVGFDIDQHKHQSPRASPSIQIAESALNHAHVNQFSIYRRGNNEVAIAFQSPFICNYAISSREIHSIGNNQDEFDLISKLSGRQSLSDQEIQESTTPPREIVFRSWRERKRESNFANRILSAYDSKCAVCRMQLKLVEAAHIIPVALEGSTDDTSNGIALCRSHHRAYDNGLILIGEDYKIVLNEAAIQALRSENLVSGLSEFRKNLRPAIALPADRNLRPRVSYLRRGRKLREASFLGRAN